jgi:hypothetical protein
LELAIWWSLRGALELERGIYTGRAFRPAPHKAGRGGILGSSWEWRLRPAIAQELSGACSTDPPTEVRGDKVLIALLSFSFWLSFALYCLRTPCVPFCKHRGGCASPAAEPLSGVSGAGTSPIMASSAFRRRCVKLYTPTSLSSPLRRPFIPMVRLPGVNQFTHKTNFHSRISIPRERCPGLPPRKRCTCEWWCTCHYRHFGRRCTCRHGSRRIDTPH